MFDPTCATDEELRQSYLATEMQRRALDAEAARVSAELERRGTCDTEHGLATGSWLAARTDLPPGDCRYRVKVSTKLVAHLPILLAALAAGRISWQHVQVVYEAANPRIIDLVAQMQDALIEVCPGPHLQAVAQPGRAHRPPTRRRRRLRPRSRPPRPRPPVGRHGRSTPPVRHLEPRARPRLQDRARPTRRRAPPQGDRGQGAVPAARRSQPVRAQRPCPRRHGPPFRSARPRPVSAAPHRGHRHRPHRTGRGLPGTDRRRNPHRTRCPRPPVPRRRVAAHVARSRWGPPRPGARATTGHAPPTGRPDDP